MIDKEDTTKKSLDSRTSFEDYKMMLEIKENGRAGCFYYNIPSNKI
jgi:hypothetical protein